MIVNSILEVMSIGALLPLLSIMMDNQLNVSFVSKIFATLENLNIRLDIYLIVILLFISLLHKILIQSLFYKRAI